MKNLPLQIIKVSTDMSDFEKEAFIGALQTANAKQPFIVMQTDAKIEFIENNSLLKKYIRHVDDCEGTDFIDQIGSESGDFSNEEITILKGLKDLIELERQ